MAKGDMNGAASAGPMALKMDQYSVMHKIMDNLGGQMGGVAPSMNFQPNVSGGGVMGGPIKPLGSSPYLPQGFGGQYGHDFSNSIPNFGSGGIVPNNPQEMINRTMSGNNGLRMM